jgi:hypothetical protein
MQVGFGGATLNHTLPCAFDETERCATPEQRLMMATIATAVADIIGNTSISNPSERARACQEAIDWFEGDGPDFRYVCELAGLDPAHVRNSVLVFIASGQSMPRVARVPKTFRSHPDLACANVEEVAELAGVSVSTVRNVMANKGTVKPETRSRVRWAIHELEPSREAA